MRSRFLPASFLLALTAALSLAADWPQWRGPNRDGYSAEKGLLNTWPKEGPKLLYSLTKADDIGTGYGQPAVVGDKFYIIGADGTKQDAKEYITCLNVADGKRVWRTPLNSSAGKYSDGWGGGPRSTPTVSGDMVYVLGATGDLVALTLAKGEIKWHKNLKSDFSGTIPNWGYAESVLIDGDNLICTPGGAGGMIALNKTSGTKVWQCTELKDQTGYSSIVIAEVGGVKQYVQQQGGPDKKSKGYGFGIRAKDGKLLWQVSGMNRNTAVIPSPVVQGDSIFFTAGYGAGCQCIKLEKEGADKIKASELYANDKMTDHHGGVIGFNNGIFGHSDSNGGNWVFLDTKSGEVIWKNKSVGKGSVSYADGYFYCYSEANGTLARVKANEKDYEEAGKFTIPKTSTLRPKMGRIWAHPVIANGKLFLRDYDLLFVYDLLGPRS